MQRHHDVDVAHRTNVAGGERELVPRADAARRRVGVVDEGWSALDALDLRGDGRAIDASDYRLKGSTAVRSTRAATATIRGTLHGRRAP